MRDSITNLPLAQCRKPPVFELVAATVRRTVAFRWVRILIFANKKPLQKQRFLLAEDEGFEPPQTESESGVLPLHKSSIWWRQQDSNL